MTVRYCDRCGTALAADARFCAGCGAPRPADPAGTFQPDSPQGPIQAAPTAPASPATPVLPPVAPAPPSVAPVPPPVLPTPPARPAASPGAVSGWNPSAPARQKGRSCGCIALPLLLVVVTLVTLAAIGGAFDGGPGMPRATAPRGANAPGGTNAPRSTTAPGGAAGNDGLPTATGPLAGTITLGTERAIGSETSSPTSNTTLTAPAGGPAAGLKLRIPGDAYGAPVEFVVSTRPVTVEGYGGKVTALSDLITVENGGAYSASPMTVTIPVTIPEGMFAMGFFRHDDGSLEAMPLVGETPTSVTVATRHFSSFLVLAVAEAALPENVGTGFRPGEDDFQAPNYGTLVSRPGACAGQSIGAIWYFLERRSKGASQLYGLTDNLGRGGTMPFWQDDRSQYRLTSAIQKAIDWTSLAAKLSIAMTETDSDSLQWDAFRYAMLVTGHPQLVGLEETGLPGGHAIIAYAATPTGLWVADPNHPGELRNIAWNATARRFDAYASGPTVPESDHMYDIIGLEAETAYIDWATVGSLWAAADAGTVGDDRFPVVSVQLQVKAADGTKTYQPLKSGPVATTQPWLGIRSITGATLRVTFFKGTEPILTVDEDRLKAIRLDYGINDLGVYIEAKWGKKWRFVDFQRFELVAPPPSGMPTLAPVTPKPEPTYDCSVKPPGGIAAIDWSLHCEGIGKPISP